MQYLDRQSHTNIINAVSIWETGPLSVHSNPEFPYVPRLGVDGTEVAAAAIALYLTLVLNTKGGEHAVLGSANGNRLCEIINLARDLPAIDPLISFNSHTASIVHPLKRMRHMISTGEGRPTGFRQRLKRLLRLSPGRTGLSEEQEAMLDHGLHSLLCDMRKKRPYIPRNANDVLGTQNLLHLSLGLPLTIVWIILERAEY
ncbi:uncharacterized protein C8Q71DRAFT_471079 [Rhodofomes roseus]|uniref:Uncharacterized protein n=1 Tax=Rhodofomes roseus TaxID=34475 RepID=A0ABQ8KNH5_9APHY|nr:uncharacterized protein C8Q71DRAFT_471079 [Rhodofomes roseus]KAH9839969.1 hypothetical protein C8Q71DRAFT_471079 [Rhodofomes roseus]